MTEVTSLREAIVAALPGQTSYFGDTPNLRHLYVPPAHVRALRTECHLVVGTRGVGKSVWTAALANAELRKALGSSVPELDRSEVSIGFAETERIDSYPSAGTFGQLLESGVTAFDVWQAVVARWLAIDKVPHENWAASVDWVRTNPEIWQTGVDVRLRDLSWRLFGKRQRIR